MIEVEDSAGSKQKRFLGLALSGGGFRASIFHMGVMRRLYELGLLDKIDVVSCVSGGSIVGAYYVEALGRGVSLPDIEQGFSKELKANVRMRSLTAGWLFHPVKAARALLPGRTRTHITATEFDRLLFHKKRLADLPEHPKLLINSTCMNSGRVWKFSRARMGEYSVGSKKDPDFSLAEAVGASAAVPGLFPPLVVPSKQLEGFELEPAFKSVKKIKLSDGGVRDNQGITSLFAERCDYVICSDASGLLKNQMNPSNFSAAVLLRANSITMAASRNLLIQDVFGYLDAGEIRQAVFFDMQSSVSGHHKGIPAELQRLVSAVRTDLDWFSDIEIETILYHGYTLLDQKLGKYATDLLPPQVPARTMVIDYDEQKLATVKQDMKKSHKRRLRPHRFS
jgi:NTE family protein